MNSSSRPASRRRQALWFVLLWLAGVLGTGLLVLPFHLLVAAARASA